MSSNFRKLQRRTDFESGGPGFESLPARQYINVLGLMDQFAPVQGNIWGNSRRKKPHDVLKPEWTPKQHPGQQIADFAEWAMRNLVALYRLTMPAIVDIVGSVLALVLDRQHVRVRRDSRPAS